ncbi:MAG: hypothetical protein M1837_001617 [Sclerophora amabilis]|nr:MAG: hypothetical protein M1837_001617 [Sclerophora amabilis]
MPRPRRDSNLADHSGPRGNRASREAGAGARPHGKRDSRDPGTGARQHAKRSSRDPEKSKNGGSTATSSQLLSEDSLAKLNAANTQPVEKATRAQPGKAKRNVQTRKRKKRVASGAVLEEGRGTKREQHRRKRNRCLWIFVAVFILLLVILIPVGVLVVGKNNGGSAKSNSASSGTVPPNNGNLDSISESDIPTEAKGTILDPFSWYDTNDFNVTYTDAKIGGLPIMGLFSTWDDSKRAHENVPPLNEPWQYGPANPIRGVNVGGWLSIEPFITPSLFESYDPKLKIVDEYTLCKHLGPSKAKETLEKHYATFVTEQTMADIAAAGMDHIRIPYSYWAIATYPGDPYVPQVSWRYLLRGIEWARKHGLRINLDLHGLPGSQNGWNHSGRFGQVRWLNGTDGDLNGQRSLDIHEQVAEFFAQPRYKNILSIYGLANEPKMTKLEPTRVEQWTTKAITIVREKGITAKITFGDGFLGLSNWKGKFTDFDGLILDAHQYVIFNTDQISFPHKEKVTFTCAGWSGQTRQSMNRATGFGPTICGEWSQADTDCAKYLNNVNVGSRWMGTLDMEDDSLDVLTPSCPSGDNKCQCDDANADSSRYSDSYKQFLQMFAEAQMTSFEVGWGWFYWTWDTEKSVQWSWKKGLEAGILPNLAYRREFNCSEDEVPDFEGLSEDY